jgi:hypothetical protein
MGTEIIQGTSGNYQELGSTAGDRTHSWNVREHQEPEATARDRIHSGNVREPLGARGYSKRQESFKGRQGTTKSQGDINHSRDVR